MQELIALLVRFGVPLPDLNLLAAIIGIVAAVLAWAIGWG